MAVEPFSSPEPKEDSDHCENGHIDIEMNGHNDAESSGSDDDDDLLELHEESATDSTRVAIACDDGCVRIYGVASEDKLNYIRSLPRVGGETATRGFLLNFGAQIKDD